MEATIITSTSRRFYFKEFLILIAGTDLGYILNEAFKT